MTQAEPVTALPGSGDEAAESPNLQSEPLGNAPTDQSGNDSEEPEGADPDS